MNTKQTNIRISLFLCSSTFVIILLSFIPLYPAPTRNNSHDGTSFIPAYSQSKADDVKDPAGYTSFDTGDKILEKEEIGDFICTTNIEGIVHCDEQIKTEVLPADTSDSTASPSNPSTTDGSGKLQNLIVKSSNNMVKEISKYELTFTTQTKGRIAFIEIEFPPGFQLDNANLLQRSGIESPLFFSSSTSSVKEIIRLAVNPAQTVGSESTIKLHIGNIINSYASGNNYQVTIATKDTQNNIIDGPVVSAPFELKENTNAETIAENFDSNTSNEGNIIKESTTGKDLDDKIIVDELNVEDDVSKDLILGVPPVDKDSVRKIVKLVLPCKHGEMAVVGGYEVMSNTNERPENNALKVFVKCVTL
jgi:hypothetical protein